MPVVQQEKEPHCPHCNSEELFGSFVRCQNCGVYVNVEEEDLGRISAELDREILGILGITAQRVPQTSRLQN